MNAETIKVNFIYGILAIVPIGAITVLLIKLVNILQEIAQVLGLQSALGASIAVLLSVIALTVIIYVTGLLIRTQVGGSIHDYIETKLLVKVPGYKIISGILKGIADSNKSYPPALIQLYGPDTAVLGFIMEHNANGTVTVFVPSTPAMTIGNIHIVATKRITELDAKQVDVMNCLSEWGEGSSKLFTQQP